MERPCNCDRDDCRPCWLYFNDPEFRKLWSGNGGGRRPDPTKPRLSFNQLAALREN